MLKVKPRRKCAKALQQKRGFAIAVVGDSGRFYDGASGAHHQKIASVNCRARGRRFCFSFFRMTVRRLLPCARVVCVRERGDDDGCFSGFEGVARE